MFGGPILPGDAENDRDRGEDSGGFDFAHRLDGLGCGGVFADVFQHIVVTAFQSDVKNAQFQGLQFFELFDAETQDVPRGGIGGDAFDIRQFFKQVGEDFFELRQRINEGIGIEEKDALAIPLLRDGIDDSGDAGGSEAGLHIGSEGVYFFFDISHGADLEFGATLVAEGAGVVGAAGSERQEIGPPFGGRPDDIRAGEFFVWHNNYLISFYYKGAAVFFGLAQAMVYIFCVEGQINRVRKWLS